jgi:hypothetical protein
MDSNPILQELIDRDQIRQLAERYALAVDSKDIDTLASLFDEEADSGRWGRGREGVKLFYDQRLRAFVASMHLLGNHVIDFDDEDHAHGTLYCRAHHHMLKPDHWIDLAFTYCDQYVRRADRWYFKLRTLKIWYHQEIGLSGHSIERHLVEGGRSGPFRGEQLPEAFPTFTEYWNRPPAPKPF